MVSGSSARVSKVSVAIGIVLLLMAMLLPVCHLHPLLDKAAPDHCAICVSLHVAAPLGTHVAPAASPLLPTERVVIASVHLQPIPAPRFAESRAPPLAAC